MKVARKHIMAALESGKLMFFPKYAIKAKPYTTVITGRTPAKDKPTGEFGWHISVLPR